MTGFRRPASADASAVCSSSPPSDRSSQHHFGRPARRQKSSSKPAQVTLPGARVAGADLILLKAWVSAAQFRRLLESRSRTPPEPQLGVTLSWAAGPESPTP